MTKTPKTLRLSVKTKDKLHEHSKPSNTEYTITKNLRRLRNYINFSEPDPSTLTHSPAPSPSSIRADNRKNRIPIPYGRPIISLPESSILFTLLLANF